MSTRSINRKKVKESKKRVQVGLRNSSIKGFQDRLREYCFVDDKDRLIVEMIEGSKFVKTEKLPIPQLTSFHDIYIKTGSSFKNDYTPSIYLGVNFSINGVVKEGLSFDLSKGSLPELFTEDNLLCYTLDSKFVRRFYSEFFGYRSGYNGKLWNDLTYYNFYSSKEILDPQYISTIKCSQSINTLGKIETPLGKCVNM